MKAIAVTTLIGLVLLNCFLGYSGQALAERTREVAAHERAKLPGVSECVFELQPGYYFLSATALALALLGLAQKLDERVLIYCVIGLLIVDVVVLFISLWAFSNVHFLLSPAALHTTDA